MCAGRRILNKLKKFLFKLKLVMINELFKDYEIDTGEHACLFKPPIYKSSCFGYLFNSITPPFPQKVKRWIHKKADVIFIYLRKRSHWFGLLIQATLLPLLLPSRERVFENKQQLHC